MKLGYRRGLVSDGKDLPFYGAGNSGGILCLNLVPTPLTTTRLEVADKCAKSSCHLDHAISNSGSRFCLSSPISGSWVSTTSGICNGPRLPACALRLQRWTPLRIAIRIGPSICLPIYATRCRRHADAVLTIGAIPYEHAPDCSRPAG